MEALDLNNLIQERRKAVTNCLNLECQREQLQILIEKLSSISCKRIGNLLPPKSTKTFIFGKNKTSITDEIQIAQKNKLKIETEINKAKQQLLKINNSIKK